MKIYLVRPIVLGLIGWTVFGAVGGIAIGFISLFLLDTAIEFEW